MDLLLLLPPPRNASLATPHNGSSPPSARPGPPGSSSSYSPPAVAGLAAVVGFLIAFTIVGNVLVVIAVLTSGALRAPQNLFLVSLASADILVAALVMPFSLANELMAEWSFGKAWCSVYLALDVLFCTSSIVHLCAISLDRYWSVTQAVEYNHKRTPRRIKGVIVLVWLLSALISSPPLVAKYWEPDGQPPSQCKLNDDTWYILSSCIGSFFAPCLIMGLVYARIYRVAKLRTRTLSEKRPPPDGGRGGGGGGASAPSGENGLACAGGGGGAPEDPPWWPPPAGGAGRDVALDESSSSTSERRRRHPRRHPRRRRGREEEESRAKARGRPFPSSSLSSGGPHGRLSRASLRSLEFFSHSQRRRRGGSVCQRGGPGSQAREKRFTFVLAVVMGVFVVCWFPFFFSYSLYGICREACQVPEALFKFFFWIGYCNSSLNPVIYTIFNQDFRRSFKHILFGRTGRRRRKRKAQGKSWSLASLH